MGKKAKVAAIVGFMKALSDAQQAQAKVDRTLYMHSQKYRDKIKMDLEAERQKGPIRLEQKRAEAGIVSPVQQSQIDFNTARTTKAGQQKTREMIEAKVAQGGIEALSTGERIIFDIMRGEGEQPVVDPQTGEVVYNRPKKSVFKPGGRTNQKTDFLKSLRNSYLSGETTRDEAFSQIQDFDPTMDMTKVAPMIMTWEMEKRKRPATQQKTAQRNLIGAGTARAEEIDPMQAKREQAKAAGYTDEEINAYLKGQ